MTTVGYQVVGRVATAGGAVVWQARDVALDRVVALKAITAASSAEARTLAALSSPHVVEMYGVVEDGERASRS